MSNKQKLTLRNPSAAELLYEAPRAGNLVLVVKDADRLHCFDSATGRHMHDLGHFLERPYGLAKTDDGHVVTLNNAFYGTNQTETVIFDALSGATLRRAPFAPYADRVSGRSPHKPRFIACRGDTLVVTDLGVDEVYLTSLSTGAELRRFGRHGGRPGQFNFVSGVTIDGAGNFLIADAKNDRVQLFSASGEFACGVALEAPGGAGAQRAAAFASSLHLTSDARLLVASRAKHVVNVFRLRPAHPC